LRIPGSCLLREEKAGAHAYDYNKRVEAICGDNSNFAESRLLGSKENTGEKEIESY